MTGAYLLFAYARAFNGAVLAMQTALDGVWNEELQDERAFMAASFNLASASVAMTDAILAQRPDAVILGIAS